MMDSFQKTLSTRFLMVLLAGCCILSADTARAADPGSANRENLVWTDASTGLMWYRHGCRSYQNLYGGIEPASWKVVRDWIRRLNANQTGGFSDWRLPFAEEYATLYKSGAGAAVYDFRNSREVELYRLGCRPEIKLLRRYAWSGEQKDGKIVCYDFLDGQKDLYDASLDMTYEFDALAVRTVRRKPAEKEAPWFLFYRQGKASGFLHISHRTDRQVPMIRQFNHEWLMGELDKDRQLFKINTQSREDGLFTPEWITIQKTEYSPDKTIVGPEREIGFRSVAGTDIKAGILVKGSRNAYDVRIPSDTATDLVLLTAIETFPYEKNFSLRLNLIETLTLDLKTGIRIRYQGKDPGKNNLHLFSQTGKSAADYWLNDRHELMEWQWDQDRKFVRGTEDEAMTILQ